MKHNNQRNIKIVSELMNFCYSNGGKNMTIDVKTEEDRTLIYIKSKIENLSEATLEISRKLLNAPRCHEIEEYYWNLTGDDDTDSELTLVGMMTDETCITYEDNILEIKVVRKQ
ncbi:hypothetical protein [Haloimpatiens lingqiaonensis]|uniref:hypothetical protein n=1 Tax=Haloimpatiens lingqiaonensis TaxID=1380675 RepID=UPI0010FEB372|nr:hypothetical protein [Haloimpatiens lingqiaonensis]